MQWSLFSVYERVKREREGGGRYSAISGTRGQIEAYGRERYVIGCSYCCLEAALMVNRKKELAFRTLGHNAYYK